MACAKASSRLGASVACLDYVVPSPQGSTWGLGGTCVNVGCIPKKLMHTAGLHGEAFSDAAALGWSLDIHGHSWPAMVSAIQAHIRGLNGSYKTQLREAGVTYVNAHGRFLGPHQLLCTDGAGRESVLSAAAFVVAVGGRPRYLGVPGDRELCITSDDVFSLPASPGRTLVVGASYIALETAGFLHALGLDVTVMARSVFLRGFDREVADHVASHMERSGVRVIRGAAPTRFEREPGGGVRAHWSSSSSASSSGSGAFDTVLLAVGRDACTSGLGLEAAGVAFDPATGKIPASPGERTNVPHVYALGDVLEGRQELTPVAIRAGQLLAQRLFGGGTAVMDYDLVPTTVFTPLEYGCVGASEEQAIAEHGADNVEVYVAASKPLEWAASKAQLGPGGGLHREDGACLYKARGGISRSRRTPTTPPSFLFPIPRIPEGPCAGLGSRSPDLAPRRTRFPPPCSAGDHAAAR